jgi:hypothetical protein
MKTCLLALAGLLGLVLPGAGQESLPRWPAPELTDANYAEWLKFVRPTARELAWREVRWHKALSEAAAEARQLERPILLWTMNGHPCGET